MTQQEIRVLVVDDSKVVRQLLVDIINEAEGLTVAGVAADGMDALEKIETLKPDIVTLDVQMPNMDGLETLDAALKQRPLPIIMVSALTQRCASITLSALERGAVDYIAKPSAEAGGAIAFAEELVRKLRVMAGTDVKRVMSIRESRKNRVRQTRPELVSSGSTPQASNDDLTDFCIAIGISTGGPPALSRVIARLQPPMPPIVIVQHMPGQFTPPFAQRLDSLTPLEVRHAEQGDVLMANRVLLAPGGLHLAVSRRGSQVVARIRDGEPVSSHKPSVDVMMQSVAATYGKKCLGIIMTGMGYDGVEGCRAIQAAGGKVLGQDEQTSDVYGMNKAAFVKGYVDQQFALDELPALIARELRRNVSAKVATT